MRAVGILLECFLVLHCVCAHATVYVDKILELKMTMNWRRQRFALEEIQFAISDEEWTSFCVLQTVQPRNVLFFVV